MKELAKQYDPSQVEDRIYQFWLDGGYFHTKADPDKKPYTIVMPPPNVTGQLHMGHAVDNTMQDILIRTKRMQGYAALWVPGTDHASIATEAKVVEAMRAEGLTKEMVGRDGFLERAWAWKTKYGNRIVSQLKKLGCSCDWQRERFTMDEGCSDAVKEVFVRLYDKGLIYRGNRMVNWCPHCNTARYCLGNLDGFNPDDLVPAAEMEELDRWAVTKLNQLTSQCFAAYDNYEFHVVSHAINDFCVVELSSFYLDIIKARLYCEEADGKRRRSAQTALFLILDTMTKIMAPILAFTCDEIWQSMPHRADDDGRNVVLNQMNQPFAGYALAEDTMAKWDKIISVRTAVNAALESARAEKKIGKSLEAQVSVTVPAEDAFLAEMNADELADLFIVSQADLTVGSELSVAVAPAQGEKCQRCWKHHPLVGSDAKHPALCPRCAKVVAALNIEE